MLKTLSSLVSFSVAIPTVRKKSHSRIAVSHAMIKHKEKILLELHADSFIETGSLTSVQGFKGPLAIAHGPVFGH